MNATPEDPDPNIDDSTNIFEGFGATKEDIKDYKLKLRDNWKELRSSAESALFGALAALRGLQASVNAASRLRYSHSLYNGAIGFLQSLNQMSPTVWRPTIGDGHSGTVDVPPGSYLGGFGSLGRKTETGERPRRQVWR